MKTSAFLVWLCCGAGACAADIAIPPAWLRSAPGPREAATIEQGASRHGWPAMADALRASAMEVYARGDVAAAEAWARAANWAAMWAETEAEEDARWRQAMEESGWPGARVDAAASGDALGRPLANRLPVELREQLLAGASWSADYFALEQPVDRRAEVLSILARLRARDAKAFEEFGQLALAVALVHDTPPPPSWPHWQVTAEALPRRLRPAEDVFAYLAALSRDGKSLWPANKLEAAELKFAVDFAVSADECAWAVGKVRAPLSKLSDTYGMVSYRQDRIEENAYVWTAPTYRLEDILRAGGICVDQAYFSTQAGKARGVPTLLFSGAGRDGRHAWFGYLGVGRKWVMNAGRSESQNYVTGVALDPQTWMEVSDHELKFLSEGFWRERNARDARTHAAFARWLREAGKTREAEAAARAAARLERRTLAAWDELLALRPQPGEAREAVAREAAGGLTMYPDLQAKYLSVAVESLRARGEVAEADRLGRDMARRFADKRGDLSTREIAGQLARAQSESIDEQMRIYRGLLRQFGRGAGAGMWDEVVRPFVVGLAAKERWKEARAALAIARETLSTGYGSQIDTEMRALDTELAGRAKAAAEAPK